MIRTIFHIARKDIRLLMRDPLSLFFVVVFPVLFGLFIGVVFTGIFKETPSIDIAVVVQKHSSVSSKFYRALIDAKNVSPVRVELATAQDQLHKGKIGGYIVLGEDFENKAGRFDDPPVINIQVNPASFAAKERIVASVYYALMELAKEKYGQAMASLIEKKGQQDSVLDLVKFEEQEILNTGIGQMRALSIQKCSAFEISFPLAIMWGIVGSVATFATLLVKEKLAGTYLRLKAAPIPACTILYGKGFGLFVVICIVIIGLIGMGSIVGVRILSPVKLAMVTLVTAYCFVGIMMLLSTFGHTAQAVDSAAWSILLTANMFGGAMVPYEFLPDWMQVAGNLSPVRWGILAIEGGLWRNYKYNELVLPMAILLATGTVSLIAGVHFLNKDGK